MSGKSKDGRTYTNSDAARALGVDERTVKRWRTRGWLVNRPNGTLDIDASRSRVNAHRDPTLGGHPNRGVGGAASVQPVVQGPPRSASRPPPRYTDSGYSSGSDASRLLQARALRETLAGKSLRLTLEEREGRLIDRAEAERVFVESITEARTRLEAIPGRVALRLVGLDARAIRDMLRSEIETALRTVARVPDIGDGGLS